MATSSAALRDAAANCESASDIMNVLATAEALAVSMLGAALESAEKGELAMSQEQVLTFTAARAEEQAHYEALTQADAVAATLSFTVPDPMILTDMEVFLPAVVGLEEVVVAAYLAAAQEFAALDQPKLVQRALAIAAVEAEHRVAVRFFATGAGVLKGLPNDIAFEKALFTSVGGAADALQQLGWIGGNGDEITYPGPGKIDTTGVHQLKS
jgi:hypothetical protein